MGDHHRPHWSSPSASPSPPPPPLPPPPLSSRWAHNDLAGAENFCPHCRGRIASLPTRTTSLSSHSGYKVSTPYPIDDEDSIPVLCDKEWHSLHRNIPALRRKDIDTAAIKQHYYPEGGWGWLVCGAAFMAHLLTSGFQFSFGLLYLYVIKFIIRNKFHQQQDHDFYIMATAWLGALCVAVSFLCSPIVVSICRRKSTRLLATLGGLITALACLFTSFAQQFHQIVLSYGLFLAIGACLVRETSSLMLGHYFKKRREFVEMVAQCGTGVGIALFSVLFKEAVGNLEWRLGLQAVTVVLFVSFLLPIIYRNANLYHPQRRAITHLKNQRKKMKEKKTHIKTAKPPMLDFSPLKSRGLRILMTACGSAALGIYAPVFYLIYQGYTEGLEDSALVLLQTFMGFASAIGCVGFGLITIRPSSQCLISRQYLCQAAMVGIGVSLLALSAVQGYHGYALFVWLYGACLGGYTYSLKMYALERVRGKHFSKAWGFIQSAKSVPILFGVPITGYINHSYPKAGYYFCFIAIIVGASLMFLVGRKREPYAATPPMSIASTCTNLQPCSCSFPSTKYNTSCIMDNYSMPLNGYCGKLLPLSYSCSQLSSDRLSMPPMSRCHSPGVRYHAAPIAKSYSYAANINRSPASWHATYAPINRGSYPSYDQYNRNATLRCSKSVPEDLYKWDYYSKKAKNYQIIEQITTSV